MKHFTRTPHGWQGRIRIRGVRHTRHFPVDTPPYVMQRWLLTTQLRHGQPSPVASGRFDQDARAYLDAVAAMPTFQTRKQHVEEWIAEFGTRQRDSITPAEIRAVLQCWRTTPRTSPHGKAERTLTLSAASVNHRRTALMHLWTVLDGKHAPNPVRSVPQFRRPAVQPRALPYATIRAILEQMPAGKNRARLEVMAYTGLPQIQIMQLEPSDLDLVAKRVTVRGRAKGHGTGPSVRPLSREAVAAFTAFIKAEAWGRFDPSTLRHRFMAACRRAGVPEVTPYVLRHSYGTELLRLTGDLHATQQLMGHATPQQTQRYAMGANDARLQAAIKALDGRKSPRRAKRVAKTTKKTKKTR